MTALSALQHYPLQDPDASIEVLDEAILGFGLKGVCIHSNVGGRSIGSRNARSLPAGRRAQCSHLSSPYEFDSCSRPKPVRLVHRIHDWVDVRFKRRSPFPLILSGIFDTYPHLKVVHPHLGGTIPYLLSRLEQFENDPYVPVLNSPLRHYLRSNFYTDTAAASPNALPVSAIKTYSIERVVFGSDYPWQDVAEFVSFVRENFRDKEAQDVFDRNAKALLLGSAAILSQRLTTPLPADITAHYWLTRKLLSSRPHSTRHADYEMLRRRGAHDLG